MRQNRDVVAGDVLGYLFTKYHEDGHDFYFRSKHLVDIGYGIHIIGAGALYLCRSNWILKVSNSTPYLWRTNFGRFQ